MGLTLPELRATSTPALFANTVSGGKWELAPHLTLLDRAITDAITGRGPDRLLVSMPPRHGKSELLSRYLPAWFVGTFPDRKVMLASYEATFAASWGRKARTLLQEHGWKYFGVKVAQDSSAADNWSLQGRDGGMVTAGGGGPFTGKGGHLLIVDDPVKNAEEAASATVRQKTWEWWQSTAYTRLEPGSVAIVIATRWHQDDLVGRIQADFEAGGGEPWRVINLPAIAEAGDVLGRKVGEALWPKRFNLERLAKIRRAVGSYVWSAMYQQRPTPAEGGMFKRTWFKQAPTPATVVRAVRYWDKAGTEGDGDYTVGCLMLFGEDRWHIGDIERGQWGALERESRIERAAAKDQETYGSKVEVWIEQEPGSGGKESAEATIRRLAGYRVRAERVTGDKATRADPLAAQMEAGNVTVEKDAKWLPLFIEELCMFPNGTHDDQVDAASGAFNKLAKRRNVEVYVS